MLHWLSQLSDWLVGFADSSWAVVALAAASFTESIFFPIPPDLLLIGMALLNPENALWLAGLVTVSSVAGAIVGHWIGLKVARPIVDRFSSPGAVEFAERLFLRWGAWAILVAAFTPIPYKVFAILAGVLRLDRRTFVIASLIGRGARFFAIGVMVFVFGEDIESFLRDNFEAVTVSLSGGVLAAVLVAVLVFRMRRTRDATH